MSIVKFTKDHMTGIILAILCGMLIGLLLWAFHVPKALGIMVIGVFSIFCVILYLWGFLRKKRFYDRVFSQLEQLDQKYLISAILSEPDFYEGRLLKEILYAMGKSMTEHVLMYQQSVTDFKEYIELWIHEVKLPLAGLQVALYNDRSGRPEQALIELHRLDAYLDQILYYIRSEVAEKDFLITDVSLNKAFANAAAKMRYELQMAGFEIETRNLELPVKSDGKWLEFIIEQILSNSIKYAATDRQPRLFVYAERQETAICLHIRDNGIGIPEQDIGRIFEKSFTGENGRGKAKSTGMGLYIVKNMCKKLGIQVTASSVPGESTDIAMTFAIHDFYSSAL